MADLTLIKLNVQEQQIGYQKTIGGLSEEEYTKRKQLLDLDRLSLENKSTLAEFDKQQEDKLRELEVLKSAVVAEATSRGVVADTSLLDTQIRKLLDADDKFIIKQGIINSVKRTN